MHNKLKENKYKIIRQDLWDFIGKADAICITTNGFSKHSGEAVMGRGCASQAKKRYPGIDLRLGKFMQKYGNRPMKLTHEDNTNIVSFPVKPEFYIAHNEEELKANCVKHMIKQLSSQLTKKDNVFIPGWATKAKIELIRQSAIKLVEMADKFNWQIIACPLPGCGAGELIFEKDVKPILDKIFDQRFVLVTYPIRDK